MGKYGSAPMMVQTENEGAGTATNRSIPALPTDRTRLQGFDVDGAFRKLVEQMTVVIFTDLADDSFTPIYVSPKIEQLLGYTQDEWLADPSIWTRSLHPEDRDAILTAAYDGIFESPFIAEYRLFAKDQRVVWIREETVPVRDASGEPQLFQGVFIDITAQKLAEARLQEAEARYRALVEQLPAILYATADDPDGSMLFVSPQIQDILGYAVEEVLASPYVWRDITHPEDRQRVRDLLLRAHKTGEPYQVEARTIAKDGRVVWLRSEARLLRDSAGSPLHWQGILTDVTAQKTAETELRQLRDKYRHLLDNANDVIVTFDTTGRITYVNRAFQNIVGYSEQEALQLNAMDMIHPEDRARIASRIALLVGGVPLPAGEPFRVTTRDRQVIFAEANSSAIEENGEIIGVQAIIRDVTLQQQREQLLAHRAYHDGLTGLPNRERLLETLQETVDRSPRPGTYAILFIDLDNFKAVNDALGHAAGDQALIISSKRMRNALREHDVVARIGGDEFVILLTRLDTPAEAETIAERLIECLAEPLEIYGRIFSLTASIGIVVPKDNRIPPDTLVRHADVAMYESKLRGKNQYQLFDSVMRERPDLVPDL